jgi:hypothetical protein
MCCPSSARIGFLLGALLIGVASLCSFANADIPKWIEGTDVRSGASVRVETAPSSIKATVIVFLSAKCPCSASHEGTLKALSESYKGRGIQFIAVHSNADEDLALARAHFRSAGLPFPIIEDRDDQLADTFGALKTPHAFVLKQGEIVFEGGVDDSTVSSNAKKHFLQDALQSLVEGSLPEVKQARALGCRIKRKG